MKQRKYIVAALVFLVCCLGFFKLDAEAGTLYESPYVTFTPDGYAWTVSEELPYTDKFYNYSFPDNAPEYWYSKGTTHDTGIESTLRSLNTGEHYYKCDRMGEVPVGEWVVRNTTGMCIHDCKLEEGENWHGMSAGTLCDNVYYSGWFAYCADCGELIKRAYMYMSKEAVATITSIDVGKGYFYRCPTCDHLDLTALHGAHKCKQISWNRYKVEYKNNDASIPADIFGLVPESYHMYNNATTYEGDPVTPLTHLHKNTYSAIGYEFVGWNTQPDGSGTFYADEAEIYNLTDNDWQPYKNPDGEAGIITLYAQWTRSESTLRIDPDGGAYNGNSGITSITQDYMTQYVVDNSKINPPSGYTVSFEPNGGSAVSPITGTQHFTEWSQADPFKALFINNRYTFLAPNGNVDTIRANYEADTVTLPGCTKPGSSFGGWYYDPAFTNPAGSAGDKITPTGDMTLYAQWVDLTLYAKDNYVDNNKKGAVDLSWTQSDNSAKAYKLYQSTPGSGWSRIHSATDIGSVLNVTENFSFSGGVKTYTVPYSGIYTLTAYGAQGAGYDTKVGGLGGKVTGTFWLGKGDVLTYSVGGQNGYANGGTAEKYGNGGGSSTIISAQKGTLLIAGGGGGASLTSDGGAGGSAANLRGDGAAAGVNGAAGGGGGYVGGNVKGVDVSASAQTFTGAYGYHLFEVEDEDNEDATHIEHKWDLIPYVWTCPETGTYSIECFGANGGESDINCGGHGPDAPGHDGYDAAQGGKGAHVYGEIALTAGEKLFIYCGPKGQSSYKDICSDERPEVTADAVAGVSAYVKRYQETTCNNSDVDEHIQHTWVNFPDMQATWNPVFTDEKFYLRDGAGTMGYESAETLISAGGGGGAMCYCDLHGDESYAGSMGMGYTSTAMQNTVVEDGVYTGDGYVIIKKTRSIIEAYGGSNYVNTALCVSYESSAGAQSGNGSISIQSQNIGFLETMSLNAVKAPDLAAPGAVDSNSATIEPVADAGGTMVRVTWTEATDNGTTYYHKAESYLALTGAKLCTSNLTQNTLTTGIKGYYYLVDTVENTTVTAANGQFAGKAAPTATVTLTNQTQYLHIAAVDVAGNVGETSHVPVTAAPPVAWQLYTTQLTISGDDNVHPAEADNTWYVRCDDAAPFTLGFTAYMEGSATKEYQINQMIFESQMEGSEEARNIVEIPMYDIQDDSIETVAAGLSFANDGAPVLSNYTYTKTIHSNDNRNVSIENQFLTGVQIHGKTVSIIPRAAVVTDEYNVYSNADNDRLNGIYIIGDLEAPEIEGMDVLDGVEMIDRNQGSFVLNLTAEDELSGVREFYVEIHNTDNETFATFEADDNGTVQIDLTADNVIFSGDFSITAVAVDNVGNESRKEHLLTEFALTTDLKRILSPHEPVFQRGESGLLTITTWGYVKRVEVVFPEALTDLDATLNHTYTYEMPFYRQEEQLQFMVPLYVPDDGDYTITITAYKEDVSLEAYPELEVFRISGTVLDEIRTRLR